MITMPQRSPPPPASRILDEAVIAGLGGLGEDLLTELISLYFEQAAEHLIALGAAIGRDDPPAVSRTAHALRGSSSTLGAERVARLAGELETMGNSGDLTAADGALTRLVDGINATSGALRGRSARCTPTP
jgi:two-component system sensor histidine kinase BarA